MEFLKTTNNQKLQQIRPVKSILIITNSFDKTATYIEKTYGNLAHFFRLNVDKINQYDITVRQDKISIKDLTSKQSISSEKIYSVYYRKISFPALSEYDSSYHLLMKSEIYSLIRGIADTVGSRALTRPSVLAKADNKIVQLKVAQECGLLVINSLITNNNFEAKKFIGNNDANFIVKPLSTGKIYYQNKIETIQTNLVENKKILNLEKCPSYFQNYVKKSFELRITVVNGHLFPVKIISKDKIDWRSYKNQIEYYKAKVPVNIEQSIRKMMFNLNIKFAAFDFIVGTDNKYYFLELNANGQWQWLEKALNIPISLEIVRYLLGE